MRSPPIARLGLSLLTGACLGALAACDGSSSKPREQDDAVPPASSRYTVRYLVSDGSVTADHVDPNLKNPWGIAFNPDGPVWVANNVTQTSTLYDGTGTAAPSAAAPLVVNIPPGSRGPANPTGIVFNGSSDFAMGPLALPSNFIFDGQGGTLAAWNPASLNNAVTVYDDGAGGAEYTGLALANNGSANFLYAADFHNGKIDVFDNSFAKLPATGAFSDPTLPTGYSPFNIQAIGNRLFVAYALRGADGDEVPGAGLGFVSEFDADGQFLRRVIAQGALNAPWGLTQAPADFGSFSDALLVGNFGDGLINAYDADSGAFLGSLRQADGTPIQVPGLWGIAFGTGNNSQPTNALFFAAGVNDEAGGVYGRIEVTP